MSRISHPARPLRYDCANFLKCPTSAYALVPPGGEIQFYNSNKIVWRHGYDVLIDGEGASFEISRASGGGNTSFLSLADPYVGRPDTRFSSLSIVNVRRGSSEQRSHYENTPTASIDAKREKDGWRGDKWLADNDDWPVFTVTVDKI